MTGKFFGSFASTVAPLVAEEMQYSEEESIARAYTQAMYSITSTGRGLDAICDFYRYFLDENIQKMTVEQIQELQGILEKIRDDEENIDRWTDLLDWITSTPGFIDLDPDGENDAGNARRVGAYIQECLLPLFEDEGKFIDVISNQDYEMIEKYCDDLMSSEY